jgi:predicted lysophospholipase L1 biosynthesis ABC-type transport system permease subunit
MIRDLLIALLITVVGVALGATVHPLLFMLLVFAVPFPLRAVRRGSCWPAPSWRS